MTRDYYNAMPPITGDTLMGNLIAAQQAAAQLAQLVERANRPGRFAVVEHVRQFKKIEVPMPTPYRRLAEARMQFGGSAK